MLVQRQGDDAVREVHESAHLNFLRVVVQNVVGSQEPLRSSSSRCIGRRHLSNCWHHGFLYIERLGRQFHEGRSHQPNVL